MRLRLLPKLAAFQRTWIFAGLTGLALAAGCRRPAVPTPPPPPAVTVAHPVRHPVVEWDEFTGYLDAVDSVEVRARIGGLIMSTPFREGSIVKAGDILVEIDARPFDAELASKVADEARAAAQVALAQVEFDRIAGMAPDVRSQIEQDTVAAALRAAQAVQAGAAAAVALARLNVEWCRVTAPIGGRISRKLVNAGNLITGGGQGTLLTTISSIDPIYCYIDADERSVLKYQSLALEGQRVSARQQPIPCFMQLGNETDFPHTGYIDFVETRMDPTTGTIRGRGVFPNHDGWLLPGFFARVRLAGSGRYEAVLVPDSAVTADQNQKLLLVVDSDNVVQPRPVKLGALFGELRAIESGISVDDRVIVNGLMQARPGAKVRPQETAISTESLHFASAEATTQPALDPAPDAPTTQPTTESAP